jgi:hypothetical protein
MLRQEPIFDYVVEMREKAVLALDTKLAMLQVNETVIINVLETRGFRQWLSSAEAREKEGASSTGRPGASPSSSKESDELNVQDLHACVQHVEAYDKSYDRVMNG